MWNYTLNFFPSFLFAQRWSLISMPIMKITCSPLNPDRTLCIPRRRRGTITNNVHTSPLSEGSQTFCHKTIEWYETWCWKMSIIIPVDEPENQHPTLTSCPMHYYPCRMVTVLGCFRLKFVRWRRSTVRVRRRPEQRFRWLVCDLWSIVLRTSN